MSRREEEHARLMLSDELGVEFRLYDDGSKSNMPDLLSEDGKHVAEVITTTPSAIREAEQRLAPTAEPTLPHCVWVMIPYMILGGATRDVRSKIRADVLRWTVEAGCEYHWSSRDERLLLPGVDPVPILGLAVYDDGVQVMCAQRCQHPHTEPHQIRWSVTHAPSPDDPWALIRQSLHIVDKEQRGGVRAIGEKLDGYPNKHLVMYPFGPPGNLTAAFSRYSPPPNPRDLMPPQLNPPLVDVHLWLMYRYEDRDVTEGLHVCSGLWARFGTSLPKLPLRQLHYRDG
ncbi:hypothetical protein [Compostimonas suwonensis]|nr:hypothetical protein [Compostimonas suwonensis]